MKLIKKALKLAKEKINKKEYNDAELLCDQVIKIDNKNLEALGILSICKYHLSKKEEFQKCLEEMEKLDPNDFNVNNCLGLSFLHSENLEKSIEYFNKAISIDPKNPSGWSNLGCQLRAQKKQKDAIICLEKAKNLSKEKDPQILVNLAGAYAEDLQIKNSIKHLKKSIKINPKLFSASVDLAYAYFLEGNYKKGWKYYKHRFNHFNYLNKKIKNFDKNKKWTGKPIEDNKKILFFCEQGIGDTINFIRFIKDFTNKFPKVKSQIIVPESLFELFSKNFPGVVQDIQDHDYWCSIMDLPYHLKLDPDEIKKSFEPYIKETKKCNYSMFDNLYKIGICWAGNPQHPKDDERSCYLLHFKEICKLPNTKIFSLQKDLRPRIWPFHKEPIDLSYCPDVKIVNMSSHMNDWEDTASIISGLDLIISVDTSILHLSCAMGKKTFGLLPVFPDWRWGLDSESSFWYPTLKLFRQKTKNDWCNVLYDVKKQININI